MASGFPPPAPDVMFRPEAPGGIFLHGTLHVVVHEARDLPNVDKLCFAGKTDAYVRLLVDGRKGARTSTIHDDLNPCWEEELVDFLGQAVAVVELKVKDEDVGRHSKPVGSVCIPIGAILQGHIADTWHPLGRKGHLRISIWFVDASQESLTCEVPSPFQETSGNLVTLFQDAHVPLTTRVPDVLIASGTYHKYNCLWETLYRTLQEAQHFIYIAGWSVWANVLLLRERPLGPEGFISLGELLKQKAAQGVTVLLLVWDELLSIDNRLLNTLLGVTRTGLMKTHDQETKAFFQGSDVVCQLVMRRGNGISSPGNVSALTGALSKVATEAVFTHHQKTVVCDAPAAAYGRRRVVAFVGGLDVTSGRFDTPEHPLFATLASWHSVDFYQGYGEYEATYGPRQPWHDVHAMVDGPAALDVLSNFEQRWRKQVRRKAGCLLDLRQLPFLSPQEHVHPVFGAWTCQMFRSIDSFSVDLPGRGVERSIYQAYLHQIRRAEDFIYIENQYFLGSSQEWEGFDEKRDNVECKHRIPAELVAKIVSKIHAGQRFAVYVVLPMHPEGIPEEAAVQAILQWQYKTVSFMYRRIAAALQQCGPPGALPTDYLSFFFLGQREPGPGPGPAAANLREWRQAEQLFSRRQMIYVHSKLMVVDDEYVLLGSANINERSMAGDRDTEICLGMHQPDFARQGATLPGGQVAGFRLSLWAEHTGAYENVYHFPSSVECIRRVNQLAEYNWELYCADEVRPLGGHLCRYPFQIALDGSVVPLQPCFPDTRASIAGSPQPTVPTIVTT